MKKLLTILVLFLSLVISAQNDPVSLTVTQDFRLSYENPNYEDLYGDQYGQDSRTFTLDVLARLMVLNGEQRNSLFPQFINGYGVVSYQYSQMNREIHIFTIGYGMYHLENRWEFYADIGGATIFKDWHMCLPTPQASFQLNYMFDDNLAFTGILQGIIRNDLGVSFKDSLKYQGSVGVTYKFPNNGKR